MQHDTHAQPVRTAGRSCPDWCTTDHDQARAELDGQPGAHLSAAQHGHATGAAWDIFAADVDNVVVCLDLVRARPGLLDLTPDQARGLAGQLPAAAALAER